MLKKLKSKTIVHHAKHNMTHVAKVPSETYSNFSYMTRIGKNASCTCPSFFHRGGTCKHQKSLKKAVKNMHAMGIQHLTGGHTAGLVPSESTGATYMTSLGRGGTCECLAKHYNPHKQCKHQKALRASVKAVKDTGIEHFGAI